MDLNKIKAKLNELQKQTSKKSDIWKPQAGETVIRIVPYKYNKENPFIELLFHYDIGKKSFLSPASFGNADPIVEFAEKLKSSGDQEEWKLGRKIEPKMRTYVPVLVRGKESEGVKFWGFGKTVYTELLSFIADPDYGDITDPQTGRDITVEFIPSDKPGTYPKTQIRVKPKETPVTNDPKVIALIKEQIKITDIYPEPTYDELQEALQKWMNGEMDEETNETNESADSDNSSDEKANSTVSDVSSAFDKLFNT